MYQMKNENDIYMKPSRCIGASHDDTTLLLGIPEIIYEQCVPQFTMVLVYKTLGSTYAFLEAILDITYSIKNMELLNKRILQECDKIIEESLHQEINTKIRVLLRGKYLTDEIEKYIIAWFDNAEDLSEEIKNWN